MTDKALEKILLEGAVELGAELDGDQSGRFFTYLEELKDWNQKFNLTSITEDREIVIRHFLDSLTPYRFLTGLGARTILDIGAGAGFPGIPLRIADPSLRVTLVDSVEKKVRFMRHIIRTLGLNSPEGSATAISGRAEAPETLEKAGAGFDCVISRAFSSLEEFLRISLPYARPGGAIVAMKGPTAGEELAGLDPGATGGFTGPEVLEILVPASDRTTTLVVFIKE